MRPLRSSAPPPVRSSPIADPSEWPDSATLMDRCSRTTNLADCMWSGQKMMSASSPAAVAANDADIYGGDACEIIVLFAAAAHPACRGQCQIARSPAATTTTERTVSAFVIYDIRTRVRRGAISHSSQHLLFSSPTSTSRHAEPRRGNQHLKRKLAHFCQSLANTGNDFLCGCL